MTAQPRTQVNFPRSKGKIGVTSNLPSTLEMMLRTLVLFNYYGIYPVDNVGRLRPLDFGASLQPHIHGHQCRHDPRVSKSYAE